MRDAINRLPEGQRVHRSTDAAASARELTMAPPDDKVAGMLYKRAAAVVAVLAGVGFGISVVIANVSRKLAASSSYTSFCNVNENVNCDLVLGSEYARFAGLSIAWWALLTYAVWIALALLIVTTPRATRRRQLATVQFALATWSLIFSIYLGIVSLVILRALCVLCASLYLVNIALFVAGWILLGATRTDGRAGGDAKEWWQQQTRLVATGAGIAVLAFLGFALWEAFGRNQRAMSADDVARENPDFHAWYTSLPVADVEQNGRNRKGHGGGVVIVEFSDFECPYCARAQRDLKRVLPRFGDDVQVIFRHFPLDKSCNHGISASAHRYACLAATASECAAQQDRFWEYGDVLFENQSALDRDSLLKYAEGVGLDRARFLACMDSEVPRENVRSDIAAAEKLGVSSTPTFFLNGRVLRGALDAEKLEYAIRLERATRRAGS